MAANSDGERVGGAWIISSASGKELHHWKGTDPRGGFGGVVAALGDLDGHGKGEVAVAAPATEDPPPRTLPGEVYVYSGATGKELRHWVGKRAIAVAAPGTEDPKRTIPGELWIYSTATGKELRHLSARQPGELYGRMVVAAGDLDGDGVEDLAIGAPWYRRDTADMVGRVELRSGRTGKLLDEFFGDEADCWFGWHIRRAPDPEGHGRPTLVIGSLRHPVDGKAGVGVLDLYVLRRPEGGHDHGTITRGARRKDIR